MENTTTKPRTFTARNIAGGAETWRFWKDGKYWRLQGPDAYTRALEETWLASVPRIHGILGNYGLKAEIS